MHFITEPVRERELSGLEVSPPVPLLRRYQEINYEVRATGQKARWNRGVHVLSDDGRDLIYLTVHGIATLDSFPSIPRLTINR